MCRSSTLSRHCFLVRWRATPFWFLHSIKYGPNTDIGQIPPPSNLTTSPQTTSSSLFVGNSSKHLPWNFKTSSLKLPNALHRCSKEKPKMKIHQNWKNRHSSFQSTAIDKIVKIDAGLSWKSKNSVTLVLLVFYEALKAPKRPRKGFHKASESTIK